MVLRPHFSILIACLTLFASRGIAQHVHNADTSRMIGAADASMSRPMSAEERVHMELSPTRRATPADSAKARAVASELKAALAKYADTTAAVADGFRMFAPNIRNQRVYHFTSYGNALKAMSRFDPAQPTSLLYRMKPDGRFELVGAMYTAPRRMRADRLDERVPLSIARWHKHVKWCLPKKSEAARWTERANGKPVFGPESPIATKAACDAVGGQFHENLFGWMLHANVFLGDDLATIFGHEH